MLKLSPSPKLILTVGGVGLLITFPMFSTTPFFLHLAVLILLWSMLCLSLNIIFGYAGQLSMAHGAFFGTGAYVYGLLTTKLCMSFWSAFLIGGLAAGIIGLFIGIPSLRLRRGYFVIVTIGFNVVVERVIDALHDLTGGAVGLTDIPPPPIIRAPFFVIDFSSRISQYYLIVFFLLLFCFVSYRIKSSLTGRVLFAIKQDEELSQSVGISTMWIKIQTFAVTSIMAGLAGVLYAAYLGILTPNDASFHTGFVALVYLTVGGIGTIAGPIIGPAIMIVITELLQATLEIQKLFNGLALLLLIIFMPQGIVNTVVPLMKKYVLFIKDMRERD